MPDPTPTARRSRARELTKARRSPSDTGRGHCWNSHDCRRRIGTHRQCPAHRSQNVQRSSRWPGPPSLECHPATAMETSGSLRFPGNPDGSLLVLINRRHVDELPRTASGCRLNKPSFTTIADTHALNSLVLSCQLLRDGVARATRRCAVRLGATARRGNPTKWPEYNCNRPRALLPISLPDQVEAQTKAAPRGSERGLSVVLSCGFSPFPLPRRLCARG